MKHRTFILLTLLTLLLASVTSLTAQDAIECEDGYNLITHERGATCVPDDVQRVVTLENSMTEAVVTLGVQPVGVADIELYNALVNIPVELSEDAVDVGSRREPNLEAITALNPDLIIAASFRVTENYDELNAIAPTLAFAGSENLEVMSDFFTSIAHALNREAEAEQILADMNQHFAEATAAIETADLDNTRFVLSQTWYEDEAFTFRLFTDNAMPVEILTQIGLENAWDAEVNPDGFTVVGIETLGDLTEANFLFITDPDSAPFYEESPLWNSLPFVQSGAAYRLNDDLWLFGGPLSAERLVDVVLQALDVELASGESPATQTIACEAGFRLFDHEYLAGDPVCIPEDPQRILALEISALETVLLTDKELVGTAGWLHEEIPVILPELAPALEGVADTGYPANLEVALLAAPDLILAVDGDIDLDAAREIAPVVMPKPGLEYSWRESMEFWSEVLGTQALYADMIASYDARIAEFQAALTTDPTISVIGTSSYGAYMWLVDTAPGVVIADAGLTRPESQNLSGEAAIDRYGEQRWISLSEERFDLADADAIFVFTYATTDPETLQTENTAMEAFKSNAVWNTLSAVQSGNVYYVGPHWWRAQTYLLANKVLDDLFTHLTGSSADTAVLFPAAAAACEAGFRPITDMRGEVCVPENPQRIVAHFFASDMIALDLPMVGTNFNNASLVVPSEQLEGVTDIGVEPNVETVLGLDPDLIFVPDFTDAGVVDLLAEIAPTVVIPYGGDPFERLTLFGEITGQPAVAQAWIDAYEAKADARREEVAPLIEPGETATAFIMYGDDQLYIYGRPRLGPIMYDVFGFSQPAAVTELFKDDPGALWKAVSIELLPQYVGDRIFLVQVDNEDAQAATEALIDNPLWQSLPAVQNGNVYYVSGRWAFNDPLTLDWLIDEMAAVLIAGSS